MTVFFDDHTTAVTAQLLARMVEEAVAIGRAHGFNYPAEYKVGVKLLERGDRTHMRLRIDDCVLETSFATPGRDAAAMIAELQHAASEAVLRWSDPTPEMLAHAEALLTHLTFGQNPDRPCATCGRPYSNHNVRHPFQEHPQR